MSDSIIGKSFEYTKGSVAGRPVNWILLIICAIIQSFTLCLVPLMNGYILRVYASDASAPDVNGWLNLFIDGWKVNITCLIYMIPAIVIGVVFGLMAFIPEIMSIVSGNAINFAQIGAMFISLGIVFIVILILCLFLFMALVRLGKTGSIGEAFNVGAINKVISNGVGWLGYIGYCIVLWILMIIYAVVMGILSMIPILGVLFVLILSPLVAIYVGSYMRNIYNKGA